MRKLVVMSLCLLMSSVSFAATVSYQNKSGLVSHSLICITHDKDGNPGHISSDGPVHGSYSLDESLQEVNNDIIPDTKSFAEINLSVTLTCKNRNSVTYNYNTEQLRGYKKIRMMAPTTCN